MADDEDNETYRVMPRPLAWSEAAMLVLCSLAVTSIYVLLAMTDPDPRGFGTHEQLNMAACSWPDRYGMPCPTCGVTTSASLLLHLRVFAAFKTQPFGTLLTLAGAAFVVASVRALWRRESLFVHLAFWPWVKIFLGGLTVLLASWWYTTQSFGS